MSDHWRKMNLTGEATAGGHAWPRQGPLIWLFVALSVGLNLADGETIAVSVGWGLVAWAVAVAIAMVVRALSVDDD